MREIDMTPWLRNELQTYLEWLGEDYPPTALLLRNRRGRGFNKDTLNRCVGSVRRLAAAMRQERGLPTLPAEVTAHAFRRTYITLMLEAGAPPSYVQQQVGHVDATTTLNIYARVLRTRDRRSFGRAFDELMTGAVPESPFERGWEGPTLLRAA